LSADKGRVVRIGRERLRQILETNGITFQRTKTWKESSDPDRDAKLDRIDEVLNLYPDRCFAFDEFGPLTIRPVGGSCWARAGKPQRVPANYYKLHGVELGRFVTRAFTIAPSGVDRFADDNGNVHEAQINGIALPE
jgi:hypothetical protein